MSSSPVCIGIVGLGRLGRRHAENLAQRVPHAQLVAACSTVKEELEWARRELNVARLHGDYEALLRDDEVDAVFLVTPTALHAKQIVQALQAGKHVFCEKPLAINLADCLWVEQQAEHHTDLVAMVGFMRRFDPSYRDAHDKIQAGSIGRPFLVRSQTTDMNDPDGFFVRFAPTSGGIFLDCTIHDADVARWLLGNPKPKRVYASGTIAIHDGLRECGDVDNGVAIAEFDGGQLGCFYASRTMAHGSESGSEVIGTQGRLSIGMNPRRNRVEITDAHGVRCESTPTFYERFAEAFVHEGREFVQAILERRAPALTLRDATEATRLAAALAESQRNGKVVEIVD